jgi:hypothetical protein
MKNITHEYAPLKIDINRPDYAYFLRGHTRKIYAPIEYKLVEYMIESDLSIGLDSMKKELGEDIEYAITRPTRGTRLRGIRSLAPRAVALYVADHGCPSMRLISSDVCKHFGMPLNAAQMITFILKNFDFFRGSLPVEVRKKQRCKRGIGPRPGFVWVFDVVVDLEKLEKMV